MATIWRTRLFLLAIPTLFGLVQAAERPNILFLITDDQSWMHAGAYGLDKHIQTPAFDRIAREGVLFEHAYCASPSCAPSRAAILTGRHMWQTEEGGNLFGILKTEPFTTFTQRLAANGYQIASTGKIYSPGRIEGATKAEVVGEGFAALKDPEAKPNMNKTDYAGNFGAFLKTRDAEKPFFFWLGTSEPHQAYNVGGWEQAGKTLDQALLPGCLPDDPITRGEMLDYAVEIEHADKHFGRALASLEAAGLFENTLVIATSDHGNPMPRSKCNLYDSGSRVPLAARWPARVPGGRVVKDFIHLPDLAPTFLAAAGVDASQSMRARSFLDLLTGDQGGWVDPERSFAVMGMERHIICRRDGAGYPMRLIRTKDWAYIRNAEPERWPAGGPDFNSSHQGFFGDCDKGQSKNYILANAKDPKVRPYYLRAFGRRPAEELYDMQNDPHQLTNLATAPEQAETKAMLIKKLDAFLTAQEDPRMQGEAPWDTYPFVDQRIFKNPNWRTEGFPTKAPKR